MIYDISQSVFECDVFPGDKQPEKRVLERIEKGDVCNLTGLYMCAHNGTHVDAPFHFYSDGAGIDKVPLYKFSGPCYVTFHDGEVNENDALDILSRASKVHAGAEKKILIGGKATVSLQAAKVFSEHKIDLIGNESQTVGPLDAPKAVHLELLKNEIVLLEGIRLSKVPEGAYMLNCMPLNLSDTDGAPCRAF